MRLFVISEIRSIVIKIAFLFCIIILQNSCVSGGTRYDDPTQTEGSIEWGPVEIQKTVTTMVDLIYEFLKSKNEPTFLELQKIENRSSEHIDTKLLSNEISTNLIKRQIHFIDRAQRLDSIQEAILGKSGLIDSETRIPLGNLKSPNYKLSGEISDNVRYFDGKKVQYLVVTLRLLRLSTGIIVWQDNKKFLKTTKIEQYGL